MIPSPKKIAIGAGIGVVLLYAIGRHSMKDVPGALANTGTVGHVQVGFAVVKNTILAKFGGSGGVG